jgi:uncharacterized protein
MTLADELQKIQQLHKDGALSDEEFAKAKDVLLGTAAKETPGSPILIEPATVDQETRQWAMFLHLSLLANLVIPLTAVVIPILIWQLKKTELPQIDVHGKIVMNWFISWCVYFVVCAFGCVILVGIPLMVALLVVGVVFPIIGGVKANNGEIWRYPLSITFLK